MNNAVERASVPATLISVLKSISGGTGFPACADRLAGADVRRTNFISFPSSSLGT
jgi:hypothetical protein